MQEAPPPRSVEEVKAMLESTEKGGVRNSIRNCLTVFQNDPLLSGAIAKNLLTERTDIIKPIGYHRTGTAITDTDMNYLLLYLEETYGLTSEKKIAAAIGIVANENGYHPIRDYLNGLTWDGTERIRTCLHHFLGADSDQYTYEALRLFLLRAARSGRADAFALWNRAPMPMVTLMKTLDVTHLVRFSRRHRYKINMLLCWCVGRAAARMEDFYLLPVGDKLMEYDCLAVNTVVMTQNGDIQTCDLPLSSNLEQFNRTYLELTGQVAQTGQPYDLSGEAMVIGTSALARYDIDGAVNLYAGCYNNPFLIWGRYRRRWFRALLPISFPLHHAPPDGIPAAQFLEYLQQEIHSLGT